MKPRIRVLIVDDDPSIRTWARMSLAITDDLEVVGEAADGAEAMERAVTLRPDVIVMDLQMPIVDGYTTLVMLQRRSPDIRIVVHSAEDEPEMLADVRRLGVPFVAKTGDPDALAAAVHAAMAPAALTA